MRPFLAMIMPVGDDVGGIGGIGPSHPIAPGGRPPLGIWGGGGVGDYIDAGFPGPQPGPGRPTHPIYNPPYPSQGPGFPTHPIAPGGPPPGIWGGGGVGDYIDAGFPIPQPPGSSSKPPPGGIANPLPDQDPVGTGWVYAFIPGYGWAWCKVPSGGARPSHPIAPGGSQPHPDQSLPGAQPHPDQSLPEPQPHPDQGLPPT